MTTLDPREDAQSRIEGTLVARMIIEFHAAMRDIYGSDVMTSNLCAVGPLQSMIGLAIKNGHLALSSLPEQAVTEALPPKLTRELGDAILSAMWPSNEIIYDEAFSGPEEALSAGYAVLLAATRPSGVGVQAGPKLTGGEIWEFLFSDLKGAVPSELSDDVLTRLAGHITEHFSCSR